jgi:plasmanylethanolamine desaturase
VPDQSLPRLDYAGRITRAIEVACIVAAAALLVVNVARLVGSPDVLRWWVPLVVIAAALAADLTSGLVHWTADTWGRESMPVIGRRFLRPFRVHHVNPDDFLVRDFIDCNGDVAMLTIPILTGALRMPLDSEVGRVASVGLVAFSAVMLPTNQFHQWAHMPELPRLVRWLQKLGVILTPGEHALHHASPYVMNYCIATGWCNRALTRMDFFPALERMITALTGARPRADEDADRSRARRDGLSAEIAEGAEELV